MLRDIAFHGNYPLNGCHFRFVGLNTLCYNHVFRIDCFLHYNAVIMCAVASQITSLSIAQLFVLAQIKDNIKATRHWPLWRGFTGKFPSQRDSDAEKLPFDDVIMYPVLTFCLLHISRLITDMLHHLLYIFIENDIICTCALSTNSRNLKLCRYFRFYHNFFGQFATGIQ